MYVRFAIGLRRFLRERTTLEQAYAIVRQRLANREQMFLRIVERGVFGHSKSPYLPLLRMAGCELGDIRRMVPSRGVEGTLEALRDAGVYVTFDEFKGRLPIVRNGRTFEVSARDFDNPYTRRHFETRTSGSTGAGTRILYDLDHMAAIIVNSTIAKQIHGLKGLPIVAWRPVFPAGAGMAGLLRNGRSGDDLRRWFTPVLPGDLQVSIKYRLATEYVMAMTRLAGMRVPRPEPVRLDQAIVVARCAAETVKTDGACTVRAYTSLALRIAQAAKDEGLDLSGVTFTGGGEPPTPAKVRGITESGARFTSSYGMTETGGVAKACARPLDQTDVHFCEDMLAMIQTPKTLDDSGTVVQALVYTSLLPTAPKLMLNVESDDFGIVENRSCGCPFEELGYPRHIRQIKSFKKLTGEGMTLVGTDMVRVLEEVLPARFGGSPLDYQLREEEDERGFTRLTVLVNPRLEIADENEVVQTLLGSLTKAGAGAEITRAVWAQAGTVRIRREEPVWTSTGKLMPFRRSAA
jgi:hypothetical protein